MANWTTLKKAIASVIKTNGNQEITGAVLQSTLNSIVNAVGENATFAGVATPSTNPGTPDGPVFYLAVEPGTYSNFGAIVPKGSIGIICNTSGDWAVILIRQELLLDTIFDSACVQDLVPVEEGTQMIRTTYKDGYYYTDGGFQQDSLFFTDVYTLSPEKIYKLNIGDVGAKTTATFLIFDENDNPLVALHPIWWTDKLIRPIGFTKIGLLRHNSSTIYELNYRQVSLKAIKFFKETQSNSIRNAYEQGLLDVFINKELLPDITYLEMWNYTESAPNFFCRYKTDGDFVYFTYSANDNNRYFPFSMIENNRPVYLEKNGVKVGYVVFRDKQKFINNSIGSGIPLDLSKVMGNEWHSHVWMIDYFNLEEVKKLLSLSGIETKNEPISGNMCDPSTLTKGSFYIDYRNGNDYGGYGYGYTDYIPINKHGLTITNGYLGGTDIGHAVYNANKQYIRGYRSNSIDYQEGDAYVRFSIGSDTEHVMVAKGQTALPYEPYEGAKKVISEESLPTSVVNLTKTYDSIEISLPDKIYAVVGDTLQLFYRGMIQAVDPYRYNILVSCNKGKQCPRYFEYTPTASDVGTVDFTVTIKDDNRNVLSTKKCQLVTVNIVKSPTSALKVMCFGDSLTSAGTWCREADRRLTEAGGTPAGKELTNIDFVGSKKNGNTGYFGVGGWTWNSYTQQGRPAYRFQVSGVTSLTVGAVYTNNGNTFTIMEVNVTEGTGNILCSVNNLSPAPEDSGMLTKSTGSGDATITYSSVAQDAQNPLWDFEEGKMSFIPYANEVSDGQIDVVYTLLSWNGQSAGRMDFSSMLTQMKLFADTLHAEFPNAKLKIMGVQVPSVRGGMGASYGATGSSYADGYGMVVTALNMNKFYQEFANDEEYSSFVEFVNVSSQFDTDYNMPHNAAKAVNARNSAATEWMDTNGVHPDTSGYYQIADVVYRNFIANFCQ